MIQMPRDKWERLRELADEYWRRPDEAHDHRILSDLATAVREAQQVARPVRSRFADQPIRDEHGRFLPR